MSSGLNRSAYGDVSCRLSLLFLLVSLVIVCCLSLLLLLPCVVAEAIFVAWLLLLVLDCGNSSPLSRQKKP